MLEEVELLDYWNVVCRSRRLIAVGTLVCAFTALIVTLLLPKTYETTIDLVIGEVWGTQVEDPYRMVELVNSKPFLAKLKEKLPNIAETVDRMERTRMVLAQAVEGGAGPGGKRPILLKVVTKGRTPKQSVDLARTVAELVTQEYKPRFEQTLSQYAAYEKELGNQIQALQNEIGDLDLILKRQRSNPAANAPAVILLQAQLEQKQTQLVGFIKELRDVKINNSSKIRTDETRIVLSPVLPERASSPKTALNVLIAGILGFMVALMSVFFLDYLKRAERRKAALKDGTVDPSTP